MDPKSSPLCFKCSHPDYELALEQRKLQREEATIKLATEYKRHGPTDEQIVNYIVGMECLFYGPFRERAKTSKSVS